MPKKTAPKKRDRGRTFLLDRLPDDVWTAAQARAAEKGQNMRWVIVKLVEAFVKVGLDPIEKVAKGK